MPWVVSMARPWPPVTLALLRAVGCGAFTTAVVVTLRRRRDVRCLEIGKVASSGDTDTLKLTTSLHLKLDNWWLEDEISFNEEAYFQVRTVSSRECSQMKNHWNHSLVINKNTTPRIFPFLFNISRKKTPQQQTWAKDQSPCDLLPVV